MIFGIEWWIDVVVIRLLGPNHLSLFLPAGQKVGVCLLVEHIVSTLMMLPPNMKTLSVLLTSWMMHKTPCEYKSYSMSLSNSCLL